MHDKLLPIAKGDLSDSCDRKISFITVINVNPNMYEGVPEKRGHFRY